MGEQVRDARRKSFLWGAIGGVLLLGIYFTIVSAANSFSHALEEFVQLWYWIAALTVGFGIQAGLYVHVRQTVRLKAQARGAAPTLATGCGLSTVSMVACCAHHLTDFLPMIGLAAAAIFLSHYQLVFILIGVISNVLGITYMLSIIARHHLYFEANRWLVRLAGFNYRRVFQVEIPVLFGALLVGGLFLPPEVSPEVPSADRGAQPIALDVQEVAGNGIRVDVGGEYDPAQHRLTFTVRFTTHSGSLDFRVERIAALIVNGQEVSLVPSWEGSPPGGHHRSGSLQYKGLQAGVRSIVLRLSAGGRFGVRRFAWNLP